MKRKVSLVSMLLALALAVVGCGGGTSTGANNLSTGGSTSPVQTAEPSPAAQDTIVITHQLGETPVPVNPQKVVVFDFGILDTLDLLGVEVAGLPQGNVPPYLAQYTHSKYANVGTLQEPDFEALSALDPDLIIISGRTSTHYEALSELAPTIYLAVDTSNYMESFRKNMETIGAIFQKEEQVAAELKEIEDKIAEVRTKVAGGSEKALILLSNDKSISAYGPGSRFALIHDVLGFPAVDPTIEVSTHGQQVSFEYVKEKNPDYIFVIDRAAVVSGGGQPAKDTFDNDLVKQTNAYKNGKIIYLDPNYWYLSGGGLVSVSAMIDEVAAAIQ
ncbi:siderophore ABC transporter substrate-binding protein [Symbiobacterium thermophilum]|uniref:Ferrichrome ABC transporter substrate-binding protein n=1 Tax=Symbiobacterium thermophilum (strain DSM 24528 / JCM 14929 / IAM 14863 / T) TaxID=292459 RepID=Q67P04_SYMTH|nr:siderophore ABC transporter substrate-binding protein [Symbiobacterium thermophilum]BAD40589.1 ferrichrome ABC transporter substrate-binding protein [Symbiobacterium thermophilum IAM 14863]